MRAAETGDLAAVVGIERAAEMAPHWAEEVYAGMVGEGAAAEPGHGVVVAEEEGLVVGFGVVSVVRAVGSAEVENLAVAEWVRRRGAGRAICEGLVRWAREQGAVEVNLEVRTGNAAARALYAGLGFGEVGRRRGYYGGVEDAVLMRRLLARD